ncbi:MAG: hypothetical protein ACT4NU_01405 [Chromatiales bacterium]
MPNQRFQRTVPLRGTSLAALGAAEPVRYVPFADDKRLWQN